MYPQWNYYEFSVYNQSYSKWLPTEYKAQVSWKQPPFIKDNSICLDFGAKRALTNTPNTYLYNPRLALKKYRANLPFNFFVLYFPFQCVGLWTCYNFTRLQPQKIKHFCPISESRIQSALSVAGEEREWHSLCLLPSSKYIIICGLIS